VWIAVRVCLGGDALCGEPDRIDPRVREVPAAIQAGVFLEPEQHLEPLVRFLTADISAPAARAKRLHDWIADNISYDTAGFLAGRAADGGWASALRDRRSTCGGYAGLFARMCRLADLECQVIHGQAKGLSFRTLATADEPGINHSWNAVKIDGAWRLVDVTWDAGKAEAGAQAYKKEYATDYLFTDPEIFVHTHLPADPAQQFLPAPVTRETFLALPKLTGRFGSHGLRLLAPLARVSTVETDLRFALQVPEAVSLLSNLHDSEGRNLKYGAYLERQGERVEVRLRLPAAGAWVLKLYCRMRSRPPEAFALCLELGMRSTGAGGRELPWSYPAFVDRGCALLAPAEGPLEPRARLLFRVRAPGAREVKLVDVTTPQRMSPVPGEPGVFALERRITTKAGLVWIAGTWPGGPKDEPLLVMRKRADNAQGAGAAGSR